MIATDASRDQLALAPALPNVEYRVATAESSGLAPASADLVTVAQALHWLDLDAFYAEVRRVTVMGGVLAAWSYGACHAGAGIDPLLREFEHGTLGPWWHPSRRWVDDRYRSIPFPFQEIPAADFQLRISWTLRQLGGYLSSWSAVATYRRERGEDPVAPLLERLAHLWGPEDAPRDVTWPLSLRVGRVT